MELRTTGLAVRLEKKNNKTCNMVNMSFAEVMHVTMRLGQDFARSEACLEHPPYLEASYACPDSFTLENRRSIA
jgi:hypothetical protein